jgi:hypothetical protein
MTTNLEILTILLRSFDSNCDIDEIENDDIKDNNIVIIALSNMIKQLNI